MRLAGTGAIVKTWKGKRVSDDCSPVAGWGPIGQFYGSENARTEVALRVFQNRVVIPLRPGRAVRYVAGDNTIWSMEKPSSLV